MTHSRRVRCECGWEGSDADVAIVCTFVGNREEPPEYTGYCPSCGTDADNGVMEDVPMCKSCEDEYVKDEGDQCPECRECQLEDARDARIDDALTGDSHV